MYSSQTKYVCPAYFSCTDIGPLLSVFKSSFVLGSCDTLSPVAAGGLLAGIALQVPRTRISLRFSPPFCIPAVWPVLFSSRPGGGSFLRRAPLHFLVLRTSGHHGHGPRIQLTWMALRSTCLHLKGCRSSLAIHRRCLVLGRRHPLCRRRRHHHHLCRRRRHHLLPCHRRRLFHLHLRLSWPGYRSSAWMRPPPSRARKARACRMPLCAACERSCHQLRLSCRRREH